MRYNSKQTIDWALLTSANLSKQAWGETVRSTGEVRIASWEIGVLVWPDLLEPGSLMVPTFQSDGPEDSLWRVSEREEQATVGVRIPYSLPLQQYGVDEMPWVASLTHTEPDRFGQVWGM